MIAMTKARKSYIKLLTIIQDRPERNVIIVMGDFNAKIGSNNRGYEEIIGQQGLGEIKGERFVGLCATNDLVIGESFFLHRRIQKATWVTPGLRTESQIDHMCIGKRFRRTLQDMSVRQGAGGALDHHLLVARLKFKLRRNWTERTNQRLEYNTFLLNDTNKRKKFSITLSNKFQALQELMKEETIDVRWQREKGAVTSTCSEVLGPRNLNHKGWISPETLNKIEERKAKKASVNNSRTRTAKAKVQEEYKGVSRNAKRSLKLDKRKYLESLAAKAEEAADHENMRDVYATIRNLLGKCSKKRRPVKEKDGQSISDLEG